MSGIQNPEESLGPEMLAAMKGQPFPSMIHSDAQFDDLRGSLTAPGSGNWAPMAWASRYSEAPDSLLASVEKIVLEYLVASQSAFMGKELGRIYWEFWHSAWTAFAIIGARRKNAAIVAAASRLIQHHLALRVFLSDVRSQQLWIGQRSAGVPGGTGNFDRNLVAVATGVRPSFPAAKYAWQEEAISFNPSILVAACSDLRTLGARATLERDSFTYLSPIRVRWFQGGMQVWMESNINGNTQPVLAAVSIYGPPYLTFWAPKDCDYSPTQTGLHGADGRTREHGSATCELAADGTLFYKSEIWGELTLPKPPGDPVIDLLLGSPGVKDVAAPAPPVPAPPVPPPIPAPIPTPSGGGSGSGCALGALIWVGVLYLLASIVR